MTDLGPVSARDRMIEVDVLRGWALLGILVVNFTMDVPWIRLIPQWSSEAWINEPLYRAIDVLAEGKFYLLFSFLFGLGFFIQMSRAEQRGTAFVPIYARRLLSLYAIGLALGLVAGESQLRIYATLGLLLLLLRPLPQTALPLIAFGCLLWIPVLDLSEAWQRRHTPVLVQAASQERAAMLARRTAGQQERIRVYRTGSFAEITRANVSRTFWEWSWITGEFPFLLLGFWAGRRGIFTDLASKRRVLRRTFFWGLTFGLLACVAAHVIFERRQLWAQAPPSWWGPQAAQLLDLIGSPVLSLGYGAGILLVLGRSRGRAIASRLANVGQMALTNYVVQWLVFALLTFGYGLALYGTFGLAVGLAFAIGLFALQVIVSSWYMKRFQFGPAEWLWRSATYLRRQPLRR